MQDLGADTEHWTDLARQKGPGWRVWRWEELADEMMIIWKFRLLAPGEEPDGVGVLIPV